ncbi:MAG: SPFH domain-containing protein [Burkholderiaceae bacterium]
MPAMPAMLVRLIRPLFFIVIPLILLWIIVSRSVFYAEPGFIYHVRTITGAEHAVSDVGYQFFLFGRWNSWKRAMTVQAVEGGRTNTIDAERESDDTSVSLPPLNIMFLDQVDANAEATVRFSIPTETESFLQLAHEYRTPSNLLVTALIPAFKETLQATASLMTAEDYYSGARTQFNTEFEGQMNRGIYQVRREEIVVRTGQRTPGTANAAMGDAQSSYGDDTKVVYEVRKILDAEGREIRKEQKFINFGINVVDARVTNMVPNTKFVERMQLKQKASADRAIAREQRIQEEEQRLLAIARGEREVAERQAKAKVEQIQKTTDAETDKQLALTAAAKLLEQAQIERQTAAVNLDKAKIEAERVKTLADAEAHQRRVILEADNALSQKLDTEVRIQELWANAFARRAVPTTVFGSGGQTPTGSDGEARMFMQMLTVDAARRLAYQRELDTTVTGAPSSAAGPPAR